MKVTFTWENSVGTISPCCTSKTVNSEGVSLLSCLLMDDGGIPYIETVPWIREGITKVESVLSGEITAYSWDRESWGAQITSNGVNIYSLHDEDYSDSITLHQFRNALVFWETFIESEPKVAEQKDFEL